MIVREASGSLRLIAQPDHAHLAGGIMQRAAPLAGHSRRPAILHAIAEHDNGWTEEDRAPLLDLDSGRVHDFISAPAAVRQRVWPRGVARLAGDPWAAALVAEHADTIYERYRADPAWRAFFEDIHHRREAHRQRSGLSTDELAVDYAFVRLGDLISLVFCTGWTDEQRFDRWTIRLFGTQVVVSPDVFGGATVPVEIAAKEIRTASFGSDAELASAWSQATTVLLRGEIRGRP